jgi:membrane-associated phospholipid phosphatase
VHRFLVFAFTVLTAAPPGLGAQAADSVPAAEEPLFTSRDAAILGALGVATVAIAPADRRLAERVRDSSAQANRFFRGTATTVTRIVEPGAAIIGGLLYGVGRLADNERMAQLGLYGSEAILIGAGVTFLIKGTVGRARPYVSNDSNPRDFGFARGFRHEEYRSFPSGHTTTAFAAASAVTKLASDWWPESVWYVAPILYGGAALTGLSRMYDDKHWASDVLVGAGIGTFTGLKVVRYNTLHPDNRVNRWLLSGSVQANGRGGVSLRVMILPY